MFKSFYSLAKEPFSKDIRPSDAFLSSDYQGALNALTYLQKSKGIGLLIGNPGGRCRKRSLNIDFIRVYKINA